MWIFWILAILPITAIGVMLLFDKKVSYKEWLISTGVALLMAGLFQLFAGMGMTADIETWSGYATQSRQFSRWKEYYEYAVYRTEYYWTTETYTTTDSKGRSQSHTRQVQHSRQVFDHWQPTSRWHDPYWTVYSTLGDYAISESKFDYMCKKYDDRHAVRGNRSTGEHNSRMIGGDPNDYVADNRTGWIEPVTTTKSFENRVKAAPSLFSYSKVPTNVSVYSWPKTTDPFRSNRVLGAADIDVLKWDQMNAVLGAAKKVNLIIIAFGDQSLSMANWQEAAWVGGKKNDLVICYGGGNKEEPASWVKVFGWTEKNIVKQNLQSLLLETPINNDLIPKITEEVKANYTIKDWHKFDYITIEPPTWCYWLYFSVMICLQGGLFFWYSTNDIDQTNDGSSKWTYNLRPLTSRLEMLKASAINKYRKIRRA